MVWLSNDRSDGAVILSRVGYSDCDRLFNWDMPRLLPRLLKTLKETSLIDHRPRHVDHSQNVSSSKRKSLYHPLPTSPPSFNPAGRTHSILLDENPVTDKRVFTRHKSLPPTVRVTPTQVAHEGHDAPREMTVEEREWWSSPYRTSTWSIYLRLISCRRMYTS
jgi:hypothetical protein